MRLPRLDIDVLKDTPRALFRRNRREGLLQLDHGGVLLAAELRHVGLDGARADGEDDWWGRELVEQRAGHGRRARSERRARGGRQHKKKVDVI